MKPLRVYLDSSDYSNFARRAALGTELAAIDDVDVWLQAGYVDTKVG